MSQYGVPSEYEDPWIYGTLELSIETLTGTAFEIRVSPNDTIMSIKNKIQRVEGIPAAQQHLLYNLEELNNSLSVRDYSINNGATLKLVLSMRGGPISTRRLPTMHDMAWLMKDSGDELFETLPSGSKVTVLVFRDGDHVNLFRVIENEDGTYSPLSESWTGNAIRNLFAESDPEESAKRLEENSVTMGKMQELKEKLESLSLQKKEKKATDSSRSESEVTAESSKEVQENKPDCLPNVTTFFNYNNFASRESRRSSISTSSTSSEEMMPGPSNSKQLTNLGPIPRTRAGLNKARKEAQNMLRMQSKALSVFVDSDTPSLGPIKRKVLPDICRSNKNECFSDFNTVEDNKSEDELRDKTVNRVPASRFAILEEDNDEHGATASNICSTQSSMMTLPSAEEIATGYSPLSRDRVSTTISRTFRVTRYLLTNEERPKTTPAKLNQRTQTARQLFDILKETERQGRERTRHILSTFSNLDLLQDLPTKNKIGLSITNDEVDEEQGTSREQLFHEKVVLLRKRASSEFPTPSSETMQTLQPIKQSLPPPIVKKKLRCSLCKKKLNITNTHNCRCGNIFCAFHRYSEVHDCAFDYKGEGKKLIQQANPLVAASKLPKI